MTKTYATVMALLVYLAVSVTTFILLEEVLSWLITTPSIVSTILLYLVSSITGIFLAIDTYHHCNSKDND